MIMPCCLNFQQTMKQIWSVFGYRNSPFFDLPAVRNGRVYAVDANSFFDRLGTRVVEGAELVARLIHPELFNDATFSRFYQPVDLSLLKGQLTEGRDYYNENGAMV